MSEDLFHTSTAQAAAASPLAIQLRPQTLDDFVGQKHILGEGKLLRRAIEADRLRSIILFGPSGCGKTALANIIAHHTQAHVEKLNAVSATVEDVRKVLRASEQRMQMTAQRTLLFLDEIHRFNKAQQDILMPAVEAGHILLIGATTHNPFFSVISALLSRSVIAEFKALTEEDIAVLIDRAIDRAPDWLGSKLVLEEKARTFLMRISEGDARRTLNGLELAALTTPRKEDVVTLTLDSIQESVQKKMVTYDREDAHYDTISAYIKSMRGSDPDASLYWLAKMLHAGEDPRFVARRLLICAAEDVGCADPQALVVATAAVQSVEFLGMPECRIPLAEATVYVAMAPKSNAAYRGIEQALQDVKNQRTQEVPDHLKDGHYSGAKKLGRGVGYKYSHDYDGKDAEQVYMPEKKRYYQPSLSGFEATLNKRLKYKEKHGKI